MSRDEADGAPGVGRLLLHLWRLSRPRFWVVSVLPAYVGYVLATRRLVPRLDLLVRLLDEATTVGVTVPELFAVASTWLVGAGDLLVGLIVLGPLLWTATLLINDAHDVQTDRRNPRKASSPIVQGIVSAGLARRVAQAFAVLALMAASFVSAVFTALTGACLVLAWAYSVPPIRLKSLPGADVAVNAIGIGVLAGLAGFSLGGDLAAFPFELLPQGLAVAVAVYVPTTIVGRAADRAAGDRTIATELGRRKAYQVGWWAWMLANAGAVGLSVADRVIPRAFLPVLAVFVPLLLWEYHTFVGEARDPAEMVRGIFLCALTFVAVNLLFAFAYTGLLRL